MGNDDINQALGITSGHAGSGGGYPTASAASRYRDSYHAARTAETVGLILKIFGCVVAFFLFALIMSVTGSSLGTSRMETTALFFALLCSDWARATIR